MDVFTVLALLTALAILLSALQKQRIIDAAAFRKAVLFFIAAVIVESISILPGFIFLTRIAASVLLMIAFYLICCSWGAPLKNPAEPEPPPK